MRELLAEERILRDHRRANFDDFLAERMPVLADFAEALGLQDPAMIVADPERYLPSVDAYMATQVVEPNDRVWILTRIGYFVGEIMVQRLGGCWVLNEIPDSRFFLRYVVGEFVSVPNPNAMVDPFDAAAAFVDEPPGRRLSVLLASVEAAVRSA